MTVREALSSTVQIMGAVTARWFQSRTFWLVVGLSAATLLLAHEGSLSWRFIAAEVVLLSAWFGRDTMERLIAALPEILKSIGGKE